MDEETAMVGVGNSQLLPLERQSSGVGGGGEPQLNPALAAKSGSSKHVVVGKREGSFLGET
eukprot:7838705-Alexandrium_andersonii.AAC.1